MRVRPKPVNLHADDRLPPVLEERQPVATCSPLGGTVGCPKDCSGGGLCIDASNKIKDKLLVRSLISESKEIVEPIPPLEAGKVLTMVSASVKLNDTKCGHVMHFKCLRGLVPVRCLTALKRHTRCFFRHL